MRLTRRRAFSLLAAVAGMAVPSARSPDENTYRWSGTALGADAEIVLTGLPRDAAERAVALACQETERLEACFSLYRPDSELSRLNRDGALERPSQDFRILLAHALEAWQATEGAFNPAIQPLWRFLAQHFASAPPAAEPGTADLRHALAHCDPSRIAIKARRVAIAPGMALTFNGIAQGYITDAAAGLLQSLGFGNILIDLGELYALPGRRWNVMMEGSDSHVLLTRGAVAQSAGRATPFTADGSWHHLLDPLTGRSSNRFSSVTVTAPLAMEADYLSTALYVTQPERHARVLRRFPLARAHVSAADTA